MMAYDEGKAVISKRFWLYTFSFRHNRSSSAPLSRYKKHSSSLTSLNTVDGPQNFRPIGKLKQLNPDRSQIIELVRPPKGPFGFYIARGNIKYGGGEGTFDIWPHDFTTWKGPFFPCVASINAIL